MEEVNPLVSIIVPNYNHEKFLKQRLESIFNQTYCNFEVILLDDCSTDASLNILSEYAKKPRVSHCVFNEINSGNTFIQWNKGITLAKGDFIWIAESDDFCELNFIEKLIQPLLHDDEIVLSYCQSNRADEFANITGNWLNHTDSLDKTLFLSNYILNGNEFIERFLIYKNVIPNASGVLFRKESALVLGDLALHSFLKYNGDWLFYLKILANKKIAYVSDSLNCFRYHSKSVIASACETENFVTITDIELKTRLKMLYFLEKTKPNNLSRIKKVNKQIVKSLTYEKAFYYYRNNRKVIGLLTLCMVFDTFVKNYNFKENLKLKSSNFFKSIYK